MCVPDLSLIAVRRASLPCSMVADLSARSTC